MTAENNDGKAVHEKGYFWWDDIPVPENAFAPEGGSGGMLEISTSGRISLILDHVISGSPLDIFNQDQKIERSIVGILRNDDRRVVLLDLSRNGGKFKSSGFSHEKFAAKYCLIGHRNVINCGNIEKFYAMEIDISEVSDFFSPSAISLHRKENKIDITYNSPENILFNTRYGSIEFKFRLSIDNDGVSRSKSLSLQEKMTLFCRSEFDSFNKIAEEFQRLEDFFLLVFGNEGGFSWPNVYFEEASFPARLYFERWEGRRQQKTLHSAILPFPMVRPYMESIVDNWREKQEKLGPGFYMYLGTRRGAKSYVENNFSNMTMGLEALHRATFAGQRDEKILGKIERIISEVTQSKDRRWLKSILKAEPNLKQRIVDIFASLPLPIPTEKLENFAEECSKKRNDLSHFGTTRDEVLYSDFISRLININEALGVLYHLRILQEIGVPDESLTWIFNHGQQSFPMKSKLWNVGLLSEDPQEAARQQARGQSEKIREIMAASGGMPSTKPAEDPPKEE